MAAHNMVSNKVTTKEVMRMALLPLLAETISGEN